MRVWIIQEGEPLPGIDSGTRDWRCGILARVLAEQGHDVLWWASTYDHFQKRHRFEKPQTVEIMPGVSVRLLHGPGYKSNKTLKRFLHQRKIANAFAQEAKNFPAPDIIFCGMPLPELSEQAVRYGQRTNVPVVIDVRDAWPDIYLTMAPHFLRGVARFVLATEFKRIKRVFKSASAIVAVSETYLNWALNYASRSVNDTDRVFALGFQAFDEKLDETDVANFTDTHGIDPKKTVVTFAGMFGFSYDLETAVKAAQILEDQNEDGIQIVLAGDGDSGPRVREMAKDLSNLRLTGWLDQKSVQMLLRLSSVGLAAYAEQATQTLPNKPFEYMAAGLPLLSSLKGEMEDILQKERIGLQYEAGNVDSLVTCIRRLARDPIERRELGQRASCLFKDHYDASIIYPQLVTYLEEIVENGRDT